MASMPAQPAPVTVGVDTHADSHVAAVVDQTGRVLGSASFAASTRGYVALVNWAERLGPVAKIGIEGTGTYGAGLARVVRTDGLEVVEVDRPDRRTRRWLGKSDPIDAQAAARATLSGGPPPPQTREASSRRSGCWGGPPRREDGAGRRRRPTARACRCRPKQWPSQRRSPDHQALARACLARRPGPRGDPGSATKAALGGLARRWHHLQRNGTPRRSSSPSWSARPHQRCGPARHWPGHRRAAAGACRRQPGAAGQRGCRRSAVGWPRCPPPRADRPSPAQPGRDGHPNHGLWRIALVPRHCHEPTKLSGQRPTHKGCPSSTACAASSATSPATSTTTSSTNQTPHPPAKNRSVEAQWLPC